ncbi:MAG: aminotransferase class I/II-fold pyridoxal phosphate-dependent enzyme [Bacteroides sp.]|nr:aminotransferase class I/II-fold pyridoxal phosphate-dependent enzyme [Bacteroides sp.]MCM1378632.1 aminotransferase class I/II-fold pyridoxal phosphate-dependent enzyme [Bacteroides sp.]MCM1446394.1 aminotransferase class I/II-fold pyridoxal phosphate-dependent enzyme [Prevotella sp.]
MKQIQPAQRIAEVKEYYFARKLREIARLNARGMDIISLGIGGPDRMPAPEVVATLCEAAQLPESHSYQPFGGLPQLRQAMADWYARTYGVTLDPQTELQPLIGSKEGILHVDMAFLNPGDGVLVPNPGYPTYTSAAKLTGAEIFTYDLKPENGWQPDFEALEKLPLERIKLMWVNYPHMPTGTPATPELLQKIVDFGRRHGIVIAHDNPYSHILNDRPRSILSAKGAKEICIEMNSLSKSHNMAGWRVAMLASNPEFVQWVVRVKSNVDSGQFKPIMLAAAKALELGEEWFAELNGEYAERRKVAEEIMTALGCTFDPAQRGLFLWGKLPDGVASAEEFCDKILYEKRVFITPGFIFGSNGEGYVRISLCAPVPTLRAALKRVSE